MILFQILFHIISFHDHFLDSLNAKGLNVLRPNYIQLKNLIQEKNKKNSTKTKFGEQISRVFFTDLLEKLVSDKRSRNQTYGNIFWRDCIKIA